MGGDDQLTPPNRHRTKWRPLTGDEENAAVTELRKLVGGRADLLAEVADLFEGTSEGRLDEPLCRQGAGLCRLAGADLEAFPCGSMKGAPRGMLPRCRGRQAAYTAAR